MHLTGFLFIYSHDFVLDRKEKNPLKYIHSIVCDGMFFIFENQISGKFKSCLAFRQHEMLYSCWFYKIE